MDTAGDAATLARAVAQWRDDTPGTKHRHHLNNAGAALPPSVVMDAVHSHIDLEATIGGYEAAAAVGGAIHDCYRSLGSLLRVAPHNIAVTSSATAAYAQALSAFDFAPGDTIVTTNADYLSNRIMFEALSARRGVRVIEAAELPEGGVDPAAVAAAIAAARPRLVAVTWVPTFGGLVQRVEDVGGICFDAGVPYLVDGCQAVGQLDIDLVAVRCDFMAATARKFLRGPRGIGFLYVSDSALARGMHPLLVDMRGANWNASGSYSTYDGARRFEQWEQPLALLLGMGAAARYALDAGIARTAARAHALASAAREQLTRIPGIRSLDHAPRLSAIASFECEGHDASALVLALRAFGVNVSSQSRDENAVALGRLGAGSLLRVSPHYYNDASDLDALEAALRELLTP